jgi:hypothetical protein
MTKETELLTLTVINHFAGRLPSADLVNARDLISHREWAVGFELLCSQLVEHDIQLNKDDIQLLAHIAATLNINLDNLICPTI